MKRGALIVVLGMVSLGLFLYVQPLLTIRALATALDESDVEAIRERMDAERVRQGLKDDYLARLKPEARKESDSAAGVASLTLFGRGIQMLLWTRESDDQADPDPTEIAEWGYETPFRFVVVLEPQTGAPITLVLESLGSGWQLTRMKPSEAAWRELEVLGEPPSEEDEDQEDPTEVGGE